MYAIAGITKMITALCITLEQLQSVRAIWSQI